MSNPAAQPAADASATKPTSGGKSLGTKLKIAGFILGVVAAEWVVAYLYLPSSAPAAAPAAPAGSRRRARRPCQRARRCWQTRVGRPRVGCRPAKSTPRARSRRSTWANSRSRPTSPSPARRLFISFHLYGSAWTSTATSLTKRLEDHKHQVRDNIIVIIRSAEITDLTDAGLGLIKRRILETTNRTLGKPLLQGIMFSDFSFVEQ